MNVILYDQPERVNKSKIARWDKKVQKTIEKISE